MVLSRRIRQSEPERSAYTGVDPLSEFARSVTMHHTRIHIGRALIIGFGKHGQDG